MGKTGSVVNKNKSVTAIKKPTGKVGGQNAKVPAPKMKMGGSKKKSC